MPLRLQRHLVFSQNIFYAEWLKIKLKAHRCKPVFF